MVLNSDKFDHTNSDQIKSDHTNKRINIDNQQINPFIPNAPFLYSLKTSENRMVSDVFRGERKGALETNKLKLFHL